MPTYEYACKCGHEFEELQSITAKPEAKCPECGKKSKRQISAGAGLIFKGSGFYITDYRKSNSAPESGSAKAPSSESKANSASTSSSSLESSESKSKPDAKKGKSSQSAAA